MTKKKSTKRALISSLLILAMCFTMLAGTTFAWFTDSVESGNNIIKSGKLDVTMKWANGKDDPTADTTTWTDASAGPIFNYDLWEPGYTDAKHIAIANEGTLALKYQVQIVANGTATELADVIDVYWADPATPVADRAAVANLTKVGTLAQVLAGGMNTSGHLNAGDKVAVTIVLKMQEEAGNEYQEKSIGTDFSVKLLATQYTKEVDSFDNQYDAAATFPVASQGEFETALAAAAQSTEPATVVLSAGDYTIPAGTTIENLTIEGKEGTTVDTINVSGANYATLTNLTAEGVNFVSSSTANPRDNGAYDWDGILSHKTTLEDATFKNCTFSTEGDAGRVNGIYGPNVSGDIVFDGCTINGDVYGINFSHVDGTLYLKNCDITGWNSFGGPSVANGPSKVVVENCSFHRSGYNKLRFYQDADIINCRFDTDFFGNSANTEFGSFTGGIDASADGITINLNGNKVIDISNNNAEIALSKGHIANNDGHVATWYIDGVEQTGVQSH